MRRRSKNSWAEPLRSSVRLTRTIVRPTRGLYLPHLCSPRWLAPAALWFAVVACVAPCHAAPPQPAYLLPAGARQGARLTVAAPGKYSQWPLEVWVDRPGVSVVAAEEKERLDVEVDPAAEPGVYWLRLYDAEGTSAPLALVVGTLPEVSEAEPNDRYAQAQSIEPSATINGRLEKSGDIDHFAVRLEAGQTLVAAVQADWLLRSPIDAVLQIRSADGFLLAQNDDTRRLDPRLVFEAPRAGTYLVGLFAFPADPNSTIRYAGAASYVYRLTLTTSGFVDHALPLVLRPGERAEVQAFGWNLPDSARQLTIDVPADARHLSLWHPEWSNTLDLPVRPQPPFVHTGGAAPAPVAGESSSNGAPLPLPFCTSGRLAEPGQVDRYPIELTTAVEWEFTVEARAFHSPLDPLLRVVDAEGKVLAEADDNSRDDRDARLSFRAPADGTYTVTVGDLHGNGGFRYVYHLTAAAAEADWRLRLATDSLVASGTEPATLEVAVERRHGFKGEIEITVVGLPAGVEAAAATSAGEGDTAGKVTLELKSVGTTSWSGPIQVIGRARAQDDTVENSAVENGTAENGATGNNAADADSGADVVTHADDHADDAESTATGRLAEFPVADGQATLTELWLTVRPAAE